ncbi:hypothetical protein M413DRAFT_442367 [Hebeloma cylindrosporum]|uniref:Transmembrane protein n=1 Tax=Hebeloma cylindrosporum TaxID=76867 RepID=A0A0C2Y3E1_HEBCY|nr:hypothetical protein M413DRAFT_442367 [Hebeloma cylindrosporum h7]
MSVRWVAVDDNDSAINYSSGWTQTSGASWNNQGNFGQPFLNTLHAVTGGSATFTYTFNGSSGKVIGTTNVKTSGSVQDPVWTCQVDGATIPLSAPFAYVENNWVLCSWTNIAAGQHTLKVTATSTSQAFLFDQFQYVPSPNADITGANIVISNTDSAINYDSGWKTLGGALSMMAPAAGAVMSLSFYGTGITWFGYIPVELPHGSTSAQYALDGGSPTTFTVPGSFGGVSQYSQLIFQTGTLPLGSHTLRVTSQGQTSLTPLVLTWLVVQNGVTREPSSSSGNTGSDTTTAAANVITVVTTLPGGGTSTATISGSVSATTSSHIGTDSGKGIDSGSSSSNLPSSLAGTTSGNSGVAITSGNKSGPSVGAIVGGVVGGLLLVLVILLLLYRRRKKNQRDANEAEQVQPFYRDIPPSGTAPSSSSESPYEAFGVHGPHQTTEVGNSRGFFARKAAMASSSPQSPYTTTTSSSYPSPLTSQGEGYAESSARDSMHAGASGPSSEVSAPSSTGSAAALLQPNRKREELLAESPQPERVMTHEDSGFRMPRARDGRPLSSTIVEYPPAYTPG